MGVPPRVKTAYLYITGFPALIGRPQPEILNPEKMKTATIFLVGIGFFTTCQRGPVPYKTIRLGLERLQANESAAAISHFTASINSNPRYLGDAQAILGNFTQAIADYDHALLLDRDHVRAYTPRGNALLYKLGYFHKAIHDNTVAVALNPRLTNTYFNRANARLRVQDQANAILDFGRAIALEPDFADAYYNRGVARFDTGEWSEAVDDYNAAARIDPDRAYIL